MDYREKFRKDVIIDFICFRKYGHNELDDPSFTQPVMYNVINSRKSIPDSYAEQILVNFFERIPTVEKLCVKNGRW